MIKNSLNFFYTLLFVLFLLSCREIPPAIDFSPIANYSTYVLSNIPPAVKSKIFIEDITGVKCTNCPKAAERLMAIIDAKPNEVVALALYPFSLSLLTSPWPSPSDTLNTQEADNIFTNIYGNPSAIPAGGVNRFKFKGENSVNVSSTKWSGYADSIKIKESPAIISGKIISYDSLTRLVKYHIDVSFSKTYKEQLNLSVYLSESKIISKQLMPGGIENDSYEHNHVLRKTISSFPLKISNEILGNYEPGRIFVFDDFELKLNEKWESKNSSIVIIINRLDNNSKEVVQAAELHLQ